MIRPDNINDASRIAEILIFQNESIIEKYSIMIRLPSEKC